MSVLASGRFNSIMTCLFPVVLYWMSSLARFSLVGKPLDRAVQRFFMPDSMASGAEALSQEGSRSQR